jgi:hypothetical protein
MLLLEWQPRIVGGKGTWARIGTRFASTMFPIGTARGAGLQSFSLELIVEVADERLLVF